MTRAGAVAKAKRFAKRMENMIVVERSGEYDVAHADYKDEYIEDGYTIVCGYKYDDNCKVVRY